MRLNSLEGIYREIAALNKALPLQPLEMIQISVKVTTFSRMTDDLHHLAVLSCPQDDYLWIISSKPSKQIARTSSLQSREFSYRGRGQNQQASTRFLHLKNFLRLSWGISWYSFFSKPQELQLVQTWFSIGSSTSSTYRVSLQLTSKLFSTRQP